MIISFNNIRDNMLKKFSLLRVIRRILEEKRSTDVSVNGKLGNNFSIFFKYASLQIDLSFLMLMFVLLYKLSEKESSKKKNVANDEGVEFVGEKLYSPTQTFFSIFIVDLFIKIMS